MVVFFFFSVTEQVCEAKKGPRSAILNDDVSTIEGHRLSALVAVGWRPSEQWRHNVSAVSRSVERQQNVIESCVTFGKHVLVISDPLCCEWHVWNGRHNLNKLVFSLVSAVQSIALTIITNSFIHVLYHVRAASQFDLEQARALNEPIVCDFWPFSYKSELI